MPTNPTEKLPPIGEREWARKNDGALALDFEVHGMSFEIWPWEASQFGYYLRRNIRDGRSDRIGQYKTEEKTKETAIKIVAAILKSDIKKGENARRILYGDKKPRRILYGDGGTE